MIDKYRLYQLYIDLRRLSKSKTVNTKAWKDWSIKSFEVIMQNPIFYTPNIDLSADKFIDLANRINSGQLSVLDYVMSILNEYMVTEKFPTLLSCSDFTSRNKFIIFNNRKEIIDQSRYLKELVSEKNRGLNQFSNQYTLFQIDKDQKNEVFKLIKEKKISSEFFIRGYESNKFSINEEKIQDKSYLRFVRLTKIILNIKRGN